MIVVNFKIGYFVKTDGMNWVSCLIKNIPEKCTYYSFKLYIRLFNICSMKLYLEVCLFNVLVITFLKNRFFMSSIKGLFVLLTLVLSHFFVTNGNRFSFHLSSSVLVVKFYVHTVGINIARLLEKLTADLNSHYRLKKLF